MWRGVSTLEILIAFAVTTLSISAIILLIFGNQSVSVDTQTNNEALSKAQALLESTRALARQDYLSVNSVPPFAWTPSGELMYSTSTTVTDLTQCKKQATTTVSWKDGSRNLAISLGTYLVDTATALALGGHCAASPPSGNWRTIASVSGGDGSVNASGVFAESGTVYVSANSTSAIKPDLLTYTYAGPPAAITPHGIVDVSTIASLHTSNGFMGVTVVGNYAYALNSQKDHQLVIINVQNIDTPSVVTSITLPNITGGFTCSDITDCAPGGRSFYYYNGYLYVGTGYIAFGLPTENHEFYVYCITDSSIPSCGPTNPVFMGSVNVNHNINAIAVRGHYAYLATSDDNGELTILDISDLSAPSIKIDAPGTQDALSLYILGNKLYLGRKAGTVAQPDFLIYDISNPTGPNTCGTCSKNFASEDINALTVFGNLAFLATAYAPNPNNSTNFEILDVTNPSSIISIITPPLTLPKAGMGIDYDSNFVYVPFVKQGSILLNIYYPGP